MQGGNGWGDEAKVHPRNSRSTVAADKCLSGSEVEEAVSIGLFSSKLFLLSMDVLAVLYTLLTSLC